MSKLICTGCKSDKLETLVARLKCHDCGCEYPVILGEVPDFAPVDGFKDSVKHSYTYSYSSRFYEFVRKSFFMKVTTGVSYGEEKARLFAGLELEGVRAVLEAGCGTGVFTRQIAQRGPNLDVWGLDYSYSQLRQAVAYRKKYRVSNLNFVHANAAKMPFSDGGFDRVLTVGAMQFFGDTKMFFTEVSRVLEPGGIFFAVNYLSLLYKPDSGYFPRMSQKAAEKHGDSLFSKDKLLGAAEQTGFDVADYFEKEIVFFLKLKKKSVR